MRVLLVAETASIHVARWVNQLKDTGWDVHVYQPMASGTGICPDLEFATVHMPYPTNAPNEVEVRTTLPSNPVVNRLRRRSAPFERYMRRRHTRYLARLIERLRPDVVHSLGLNVGWVNITLPVLKARTRLGSRFRAPWVYSSWGSDLDYYARMSPERRSEVEQTLAACDYYIAECERDSRLATEMGFRGEFLGYLPAFGGVDWEYMSSLRAKEPVSARRSIFLKGRDQAGGDPVGRAMTAMKAFALCQDELRAYRIVIGQVTSAVAAEAEVLRATTGLDVHVLPHLPYESVLRIVGASRALIALTVNDGLPSTLVEAMALGALPLHSDLEPIAEWITDGENGLLTPAEDVEAVAVALRRCLADDGLVERAAEVNARLVRERLTDDVVRPRVIEMYEHVSSQGPVLVRD